MLSDRHIKEAILAERIKIAPTIDYETQLGSCSVDLRLGNTFRVFEHSKVPYVDLRNNITASE
jgi:dCTP deaminase